MTPQVCIGVDVGTTSIKAVAIDLNGERVGTASSETPWLVGANGRVDIDVAVLAETAIDVIRRAGANTQVASIGITGMAETGVVVDGAGRPLTRAIAWYDQRGDEQFAALSDEFRAEFSAVTGLAAKAECSLSKLLWLRDEGFVFTPEMRWLNALEFIAFALTGVMATEPSLASRTGLLSQESKQPWRVTLELIGATEAFVPPIKIAGEAWGDVQDARHAGLVGAAVTVAGHDHLVASVGAGATGGDDLFNSCGTADVVLRTVPRTLTNTERSALVTLGMSAGRHVLPESTALLSATRSGLVLGRVLSLLGAVTREQRAALSDTWTADAPVPTTVIVSEPPAWANEVTIQVRDDVSPADLWAGAMSYVLGQTQALIDHGCRVAGPYRSAVAAGGWVQLPGVRRAKSHIMPGLQVSEIEQPGAYGAALFAARACDVLGFPVVPTIEKELAS
jgi:sugar (pentulose or hexulose) kinase